MLVTSVISALALPLLALANPHSGGRHARHAEIAKRASGNVDIHKRFSSSKWSFYSTGLGACGQVNHDNDFIVALNTPQFGGGYPGPNCFKKISMTYNGKTTTATITDQCPGCPYGGLDLSPGLFSFFDSQDKGIIYGTWNFIGGGGGGDDDTPPPAPKTTKKPTSAYTPPKPTPTYTPPSTTEEKTTSTHKTTSTPKPEPSTTSTSTTSSSSSSSTSIKLSTSTSTSSAAAPTKSAGISNIDIFNSILLNLGDIAIAGAAANVAA